MGRPARKKTYVESKAAEKGRLQAQVEMQRKKPLDVSIKEHIGKMLDNMHLDPLKLLAIAGMSFLVYETIQNIPAAIEKVESIYQSPITWFVNPVFMLEGTIAQAVIPTKQIQEAEQSTPGQIMTIVLSIT